MYSGSTQIETLGEMGTETKGMSPEENRLDETDKEQWTSGTYSYRILCGERWLIRPRKSGIYSKISGARYFSTFHSSLQEVSKFYCVKKDVDSTASKYSPEISLEDILPKSPPEISGEGARIFYEEMDKMEYSEKTKKFYREPIKVDISELEDIL